MQYLRADDAAIILIGPFLDKDDGVTPESGITLAGADSAEIMKHNGTSFVDIAGAGANQCTIAYEESGMYTMLIPAAVLDTEGRFTVFISDESVCLPVWADFMVVNANVYDSLFGVATADYLQVIGQPTIEIQTQGFCVKEKNLTFTVQAKDGGGDIVDATGDVSYSVYEDETATAILTGTMAKLAAQTGFYSEQIACTSDNGFELYKTYTVRVTATVSGVSTAVVGNVICIGAADIMEWSGVSTQRGGR